jgi:hypothetical protein
MLYRYFAIVSFFFLIAFAKPAIGQCAMCKMPAESNLANGGTDGSGLNKGILYMFVTPYILVGTIAFLWWRGRKQEEEFLVEAPENSDMKHSETSNI